MKDLIDQARKEDRLIAKRDLDLQIISLINRNAVLTEQAQSLTRTIAHQKRQLLAQSLTSTRFPQLLFALILISNIYLIITALTR